MARYSGNLLLNHSFMVPGLIAVIARSAIGHVLAKLMFSLHRDL